MQRPGALGSGGAAVGDVTLAGRPCYVVGVTDVLLERWSVEFEGIGPEGLLIVVSRMSDEPVGQWRSRRRESLRVN